MTPKHFTRFDDARMTSHAGLTGTARISVMYRTRAAGFAGALAARRARVA